MAATVLAAPRFNLKHTLESGQFFRWTESQGTYTVQRGSRLFRVRQDGDRLITEGADTWFLKEFFALDEDFEGIERKLRRDPSLAEALDTYAGLRILRQDPWECTAAFITSIACNIPRITANVQAMARAYGLPVRLGDLESESFPRPERLDDEQGLRRLGVGFRAEYLVHAARLARSGILEDIAALSYEDAKDTLMVIPGVAEKVADCVLLFAYGRLNAFPVDTWIRKVVRTMYFRGRRVTDREIREFAAERWGELAGYAQQYLFHWSRRSGAFTSRAEAPAALPRAAAQG